HRSFSIIHHPPPRLTLFPYTTLFRSPIRTSRMKRAPFRQATEHRHHSFDRVQPLAGASARNRREQAACIGMLRVAENRTDRAFLDRKSTRLNSSHEWTSYALLCLKKK